MCLLLWYLFKVVHLDSPAFNKTMLCSMRFPAMLISIKILILWRLPSWLNMLGYCFLMSNKFYSNVLINLTSGAFIFPFLIMMVLEGMPLVLLELAVGQKFRQGSFGVWNQIHPWLGGIGVGSTVIAVVVGCYYNMIIAWCIYYLINSFWVRFFTFAKL